MMSNKLYIESLLNLLEKDDNCIYKNNKNVFYSKTYEYSIFADKKGFSLQRM